MGTLFTRPTLLPCLSSTIVICFALVFEDIARAQDQQKEVLALYSTRRDAQIAVVGDREMPRILERGLARGLDFYSEHLDQARFSDPLSEQAFHDFLQLKYAGRRFDVVIAMSSIALAFVEKSRSLFPQTPVVFFSSDPDTPQIMNSTGIKAALNLSDTIELVLELQPDTRHVFVVTGTGTDAFYARVAQTQFKPFEKRLTFTYLSGLITSELESRLRTLPEHSIVYYLIVNRDGAGEDVHPLNYLDRVAAIANAPTYSWVDSAMGHGIIGGSVKSQESEVSAVAGMALRVLHGENADSISPAEMDLNVRQVDWRQLQRWNIHESRVPAGTRIVFREVGLWGRYKLLFLSGIVLVLAESALIAGLLTQARRRRRVEEQMRDRLAELRTSGERIRDLNRRLVSAQDAERSSLAREVHDDIGPQMALLAVDLELLRRADTHSEAAAPIAREAIDRIQHIAKALQDLSHRLHPATVQLIGLVAALESLQRDFSRAGLSVTLSHSNVPASLPQELTFSLFRVVQEAVRNAVKHSDARRVSLQLTGTADALALTIEDDGIGFDIEAARGRGLGLISMTERLEQFGGSVTIHTKLGAGTRVDAAVPLVSIKE